MNSAVASRHVNVVVSRSTVRRKPPLRGNSGDRLVEMRRGATERAMTPNTPMSNRQRLATMAAMEMSTNSFGSDDGTLNSNTSTGSISLKSPGGNRNREREEHSVRRRRSSSQKASTARTSSRRKERSSGERGLPKERPSSVSSLQVEEGESAKLCADDASSRSERRMDRSRAGGSSTGGVGSNRQRSSSRRRGERGQRSNSLNEKRNGRTHRISTSEVVGGDAPRKSPGVYHRSSVTEDEIMDLLSLDYTTPITQSRRRHSDSSAKKESNGSTARRSVKESNRMSRDSSGSPQMGSSRDRRERRDKSPRNLSREGCRSIDQVGGDHSLHKRNSADSSKNRDRRDTTELERSSSTGSFERKMHSPSSSVSGKIIRRNTPRRAKSEDHGLNSFLQQDLSVSRRKNPASASRSVASMPAKAVARRRRGSVGAMSDRTDATEETTKPCSSSDVMADDDHLIDHDVTDEEDDCASIDLDLATAHSNFLQTSLDAKVQMYLSKTDELLYSVFPKHIADALRNGQKVEPENHDLVTIFFSDIVGFTDISSKLDPMKISELLDRLYNSFDALSEYHDVFKVETIGDAYMAVTNLAKKQPDHCKRISEFAIDAIRVANQTLIDEENPSMGFVKIRVGFHSGPVVSNVVGTRNPRYCLFGDTVNTANRMESHSEENRINCSEVSAILLKEQCPKIRIFPRGYIDVKGKGEMKTFWIHTEGSHSQSSPDINAKNGAIRNVFNSLLGERAHRNQKVAV